MFPKNIHHGRFFGLKTTIKVFVNVSAIVVVNVVQAKCSPFIHQSYPCENTLVYKQNLSKHNTKSQYIIRCSCSQQEDFIILERHTILCS